MKKSIAAILLLVFVIGMLCSCGSGRSAAVGHLTTPDTAEASAAEAAPAVEDAAEIASDFEDSATFREMTAIIEEAFADFSPTVSYDRENALVNIVVTAGAGTAYALATDKNAIAESWETIAETLSSLSLSGYELLCEEHPCSGGLTNAEVCCRILFAERTISSAG